MWSLQRIIPFLPSSCAESRNGLNAEFAESKREFTEKRSVCTLRTPSVLCELCVEIPAPMHKESWELVLCRWRTKFGNRVLRSLRSCTAGCGAVREGGLRAFQAATSVAPAGARRLPDQIPNGHHSPGWGSADAATHRRRIFICCLPERCEAPQRARRFLTRSSLGMTGLVPDRKPVLTGFRPTPAATASPQPLAWDRNSSRM